MRGEKVLLDSDLAILYDVETKVLKHAVRRNIERFPVDFMFELTEEEFGVVNVTRLLPSRNKALPCSLEL